MRTVFKLSILAVTVSTCCSYSWAENSAYIPRIGFMSGEPARVYVDVMPDDVREAQAKADKEVKQAKKEADREAKKLAEENERKQKEAAKLAAKDASKTKDTKNTVATNSPAQPSAVASTGTTETDDPQIMALQTIDSPATVVSTPPKTIEPETTKPETVPAAKDVKKVEAPKAETKEERAAAEKARKAAKDKKEDDARKKILSARLTRAKARAIAMRDERARQPVTGVFYLYSLDQNRLLYNQAAEPQLVNKDDNNAPAPYYIEFKEKPPAAGLYDLAVKGSGHRSEAPILVSDSVYWDALKPVAEGINKAHCPSRHGRYRVVQQCYQMTVLKENHADTTLNPAAGSDQKGQLVQGGWFSPEGSSLTKSTNYIANLSQTILQTYQLNPKAFKYLEFTGATYVESEYPDILDEANWGLQYLLTIQQPDGTFPEGIIENEGTERSIYVFSPPNPEASSRAIMALATAAKVFKDADLSMSVKYMRAAEKGWLALTQSKQPLDPEWVLLASASLADASGNPEYTKTFEQAKTMVHSLTPETAILLGDNGKDIPLEEASSTLAPSSDISTVMPWLAQSQRQEKTSTRELEQWVTDLFGYEKINFKKDYELEVANPSRAPMQWLATKTGETIERIGHTSSHVRGTENTKPELDAMKDIEKKQEEAKKRVQAGYDGLSLSPKDTVYLTYTLALLNQITTPTFNPATKAEKNLPKPYVEPVGNPKGFWPKTL